MNTRCPKCGKSGPYNPSAIPECCYTNLVSKVITENGFPTKEQVNIQLPQRIQFLLSKIYELENA